jgi:hypothetical protein
VVIVACHHGVQRFLLKQSICIPVAATANDDLSVAATDSLARGNLLLTSRSKGVFSAAALGSSLSFFQ